MLLLDIHELLLQRSVDAFGSPVDATAVAGIFLSSACPCGTSTAGKATQGKALCLIPAIPKREKKTNGKSKAIAF